MYMNKSVKEYQCFDICVRVYVCANVEKTAVMMMQTMPRILNISIYKHTKVSKDKVDRKRYF